MRLIAHRVFRDGDRLERFDSRRLAGFEGVEIDLRLDASGELVVRHSPVFAAGRSLKRVPGHRFADALTHLSRMATAPRLLLLDVKCVTAAEAAARLIAGTPPAADVLFNCWHAEEFGAIRAHLPEARIFFCAAPIVARRAPAGRLEDIYLCNSFPFLWSGRNFTPDLDNVNRHNINIRVISRRRGGLIAPEGADGLTVHRLFWNGRVAALAAEQGLEVAVYGLNSRAQAWAEAAHGPIAYAIIGDRKRNARSAAAARTLHKAA
jgi:glycerophosphoryl diester phosphodiesterase